MIVIWKTKSRSGDDNPRIINLDEYQVYLVVPDYVAQPHLKLSQCRESYCLGTICQDVFDYVNTVDDFKYCMNSRDLVQIGCHFYYCEQHGWSRLQLSETLPNLMSRETIVEEEEEYNFF
jgi:hypothetical protein